MSLPRPRVRASKRPVVEYETPWRYGRHAIWHQNLYPSPDSLHYSRAQADFLLAELQHRRAGSLLAARVQSAPALLGAVGSKPSPAFVGTALTMIESTPLCLSLWATTVNGRRPTTAPPQLHMMSAAPRSSRARPTSAPWRCV